jgi:hypothetical protein
MLIWIPNTSKRGESLQLLLLLPFEPYFGATLSKDNTHNDDTNKEQLGSGHSDEPSMMDGTTASSISLASSFCETKLGDNDRDDDESSSKEAKPLSTTDASLYGYGNNSCDTSLEQSFFDDSESFSMGYKISHLDGGNPKSASETSIDAITGSNDDSIAVDYGYEDQQPSYSAHTHVQPPKQELVTAVPPVQTSLHQSLHGKSCKKSSSRKSRRHRRRSIATTSNVEQEVQSSSMASSGFFQRGSMSQELKAWEQETGWGKEPTCPAKATEDHDGAQGGTRYSKHSTHGESIGKVSISSTTASDRRRQRRASIATSAPTNLAENDNDNSFTIIALC